MIDPDSVAAKILRGARRILRLAPTSSPQSRVRRAVLLASCALRACVASLKAPSVSTDKGKKGATLYMRGVLEVHYEKNLDLVSRQRPKRMSPDRIFR